MKNKIVYDPEGSIILGNQEWTWESLKQACYSDYVLEARPMGTVANKYKVPKEIVSKWIKDEEWEYARKSHWQRPYSYRIDSHVTGLIQSATKLIEIHQTVNDIDYKEENLQMRVKVDIEILDKGKIKKLKTITLEKYKIIFPATYEDDIKLFDEYDELRFKTKVTDGEILIKEFEKKK